MGRLSPAVRGPIKLTPVWGESHKVKALSRKYSDPILKWYYNTSLQVKVLLLKPFSQLNYAKQIYYLFCRRMAPLQVTLLYIISLVYVYRCIHVNYHIICIDFCLFAGFSAFVFPLLYLLLHLFCKILPILTYDLLYMSKKKLFMH